LHFKKAENFIQFFLGGGGGSLRKRIKIYEHTVRHESEY